MSDDRLLDAKELAERLNVPTNWVREHARSGHLPCVRLGRYTRFSWPSVQEWLHEQETAAATYRERKHRPTRRK